MGRGGPTGSTSGPDYERERANAQRYADHMAPTWVTVARRAVDLAEVQPGHTVLDVGTGTGLGAFFAAERAGRDGNVVGLDTSAAMLEVAAERATSVGYDFIRWQQGDAAQLTFADESFDAVLCLHALMLMPRPHVAVEEMRRVLVEGGRAVLTVWGGKAGNEWMGILERALREAAPGTPPPRSPPLSPPGNLEAMLQAAGFEDIEVARVPDRMRLQRVGAFLEWALADGYWGPVLMAVPEAAQARLRGTLETILTPRLRDGEVAVAREIVYARALVPAED